jgi:very-short-patch-repair endonuclease
LRQELMCALLWAGPQSAVSHRSAGEVWNMPGIHSPHPEISTTRNVSPQAPGLIVHRVQNLKPVDTCKVGSLTVTTPSRTLLDLSGMIEPKDVEVALDDALRRRLVSPARLKRTLDRLSMKGRKGVGVLRELLADRGQDYVSTESVLEDRFSQLIRKAGLPPPVRQFEIRGEDLVARVDFAYPKVMLAIEVDGYRFHSGRQGWLRDLQRRTELAALGWTVLAFTWDDVEARPDRVVEQIRRKLGT